MAILEGWEIELKTVAWFVRDNTANITFATREGEFCHSCVEHTLKPAKTIVGHYNHSKVAPNLPSGV